METVVVAGSEPTSRVSDAAAVVGDAFAQAQATIVEMAVSTAGLIGEAARRGARPDCVEIEFGLAFSAKGSVIVAAGEGSAALRVRLRYDRRDEEAAAG